MHDRYSKTPSFTFETDPKHGQRKPRRKTMKVKKRGRKKET